jgi:hypothetical protein
MVRLAVLFTLVATLVVSASSPLDAQRGGGGGGRGGSGGGRGGGSSRGGMVQGRVNRAATPALPPALPSINVPSFPLTGLNRPAMPLSGPLGFGPRLPSPFAARPGTYTRLQRYPAYGGAYGYGVPTYGYSYEPESTYEKLYRTSEPEITMGALFLDVTPPTAHVFIDTAYAGDIDDLQARGVVLPAGRHWVDLEAPNYEKKTLEVTMNAGEPLRYRFDMTPERRAETIALPPRPPQTMYMIAECYAGNRPPVAANLPKGCDIAKVRVIRPQPQSRAN